MGGWFRVHSNCGWVSRNRKLEAGSWRLVTLLLPRPINQSVMQSVMQSCSHSCPNANKNVSLTHRQSVSQSFVRSFVCSFVRSFVCLFVRSFVRSFSFTRWRAAVLPSFLLPSFFPSFLPFFVRSFVCSFVRSFVCSLGSPPCTVRHCSAPNERTNERTKLLNYFEFPFRESVRCAVLCCAVLHCAVL